MTLWIIRGTVGAIGAPGPTAAKVYAFTPDWGTLPDPWKALEATDRRLCWRRIEGVARVGEMPESWSQANPGVLGPAAMDDLVGAIERADERARAGA